MLSFIIVDNFDEKITKQYFQISGLYDSPYIIYI